MDPITLYINENQYEIVYYSDDIQYLIIRLIESHLFVSPELTDKSHDGAIYVTLQWTPAYNKNPSLTTFSFVPMQFFFYYHIIAITTFHSNNKFH